MTRSPCLVFCDSTVSALKVRGEPGDRNDESHGTKRREPSEHPSRSSRDHNTHGLLSRTGPMEGVTVVRAVMHLTPQVFGKPTQTGRHGVRLWRGIRTFQTTQSYSQQKSQAEVRHRAAFIVAIVWLCTGLPVRKPTSATMPEYSHFHFPHFTFHFPPTPSPPTPATRQRRTWRASCHRDSDSRSASGLRCGSRQGSVAPPRHVPCLR